MLLAEEDRGVGDQEGCEGRNESVHQLVDEVSPEPEAQVSQVPTSPSLTGFGVSTYLRHSVGGSCQNQH